MHWFPFQLESRLPVGTPEYIAPEVLTSLDKSADYGVGCDWWSLGIIAYELLYASTPFEDESTSKTYANIMNYKVHCTCTCTQDNSLGGGWDHSIVNLGHLGGMLPQEVFEFVASKTLLLIRVASETIFTSKKIKCYVHYCNTWKFHAIFKYDIYPLCNDFNVLQCPHFSSP